MNHFFNTFHFSLISTSTIRKCIHFTNISWPVARVFISFLNTHYEINILLHHVFTPFAVQAFLSKERFLIFLILKNLKEKKKTLKNSVKLIFSITSLSLDLPPSVRPNAKQIHQPPSIETTSVVSFQTIPSTSKVLMFAHIIGYPPRNSILLLHFSSTFQNYPTCRLTITTTI